LESIGGVPTLVLRSSERDWLLVAPAADAAELALAPDFGGAERSPFRGRRTGHEGCVA
jgi:hypothetical protein